MKTSSSPRRVTALVLAASALACGSAAEDDPAVSVQGKDGKPRAGAAGRKSDRGGAAGHAPGSGAGTGARATGGAGGGAGQAGIFGGIGGAGGGKGGASAKGGGAGTGKAGAPQQMAGAAGAGSAPPSSGGGGSAGAPGAGGGTVAGGSGAGSVGGTGGAGAGGSGLGAAGSGGTPFTPPPLPSVSESPPDPCAAAQNGSAYQFLDDACKAKKKPSKQDRDRACPISDPSPVIIRKDGTKVTYAAAGAAVVWDTKALAGVVPDAMQISVILVRRVDGVPFYRYLSNGTHAQAYQPWSTSKFMAVANAAATLRLKSDLKVGLTATVGSTPLGDLVTSIHNYDYDPYSSNALARYFHDIGGRAKANALIHDWLDRPASETFGGNYGQLPPDLGYTFEAPSGATVTVAKDTTTGPANHFSSFTAAEFLKRLVHHREVPTTRLPGIQWEDLRVLFYGAEKSVKYGDWGGMTADTTTYIQQYDMGYIEARSHGQWVTFSKLGLGSEGQFVATNYACYPQLDDAGAAVPGWGRELLIATHLDEGGANWKARDRLVATAYRAVITRIMDGTL